MFSASDYAILYDIVFNPGYPGYKPDVVEAPNGDGKLDVLKRYAHVAYKYIYLQDENSRPYRHADGEVLQSYLSKAHKVAVEMAVTIGVPRQYWPVERNSALRVLEYDGNATTVEHKDFDLFTLMCYRNLPEYFKYTNLGWKGASYASEAERHAEYEQMMQAADSNKLLKRAQEINKQIHFGEILEEISPMYKASAHEVVASNGPNQYSCVYFAIPDHDSVLPSGVTVGDWLKERISRSRYDRADVKS